ncbi:YpdA family putative bacillithiol disulfide reductase [Bacillaceae bacterium S4-13-58]
MEELKEKVIIVGSGPCGLSAALELKKRGIDPLIIEKENIVHTIYRFPTHQTFFSTSEKLEIGGFPFVTEHSKPLRNQALVYYRMVAKRSQLRIQTYEQVLEVQKDGDSFHVRTIQNETKKKKYICDKVILATGYYDQPNQLMVPGEELAKVSHYFKEAHPYFGQKVVVIGGKNSAVDATLELVKAGAEVTVLYRGSRYSESIKPWVLPDFDSLVRNDKITMEFNANVLKITGDQVFYEKAGKEFAIDNDFVFAMTGYQPNQQFLKSSGLLIDSKTGKPFFNEQTMESNVKGLYIAGVIAAGFNNNKIFIENGRFHGELIANHIITEME